MTTDEGAEVSLLTGLLGRPPDAVARRRLQSTEWRCDGCGEVFKTEERLACPAPCLKCGGIAFTSPD
jgi:hypothetical protein